MQKDQEKEVDTLTEYKSLEPKKRKKPIQLEGLKEDLTINEEITQILDYLGIRQLEGEVKGVHTSTVLTFLQRWKTGEVQSTLSRLALRLKMTKRHIKENYFEGLEAEGIIKVSIGSKTQIWTWRGLNINET